MPRYKITVREVILWTQEVEALDEDDLFCVFSEQMDYENAESNCIELEIIEHDLIED